MPRIEMSEADVQRLEERATPPPPKPPKRKPPPDPAETARKAEAAALKQEIGSIDRAGCVSALMVVWGVIAGIACVLVSLDAETPFSAIHISICGVFWILFAVLGAIYQAQLPNFRKDRRMRDRLDALKRKQPPA